MASRSCFIIQSLDRERTHKLQLGLTLICQLNHSGMTFETPASIASLGRQCVSYFDQLRHLLRDSDPQRHAGISYSGACDKLGRFRIWAGNIGALQDERKQSSLDFRLREAPRIADQVVELLQDLSESLNGGSTSFCSVKRSHLTGLVCTIISGKRPNRVRVNLPWETGENFGEPNLMLGCMNEWSIKGEIRALEAEKKILKHEREAEIKHRKAERYTDGSFMIEKERDVDIETNRKGRLSLMW